MIENGTENVPFETEDVEAHLRVRYADGPGQDDAADADDTEGHIRVYVDGPDEDDVEGHVQPPRGDDTDHIHSIMRY
jgi:hypothetical protein